MKFQAQLTLVTLSPDSINGGAHWLISLSYTTYRGHALEQLVEALLYTP
jgi:hypothetical protein